MHFCRGTIEFGFVGFGFVGFRFRFWICIGFGSALERKACEPAFTRLVGFVSGSNLCGIRQRVSRGLGALCVGGGRWGGKDACGE